MRTGDTNDLYVDNFNLLVANLKNLQNIKTTKYSRKIEMNISNLKNGSNL